MNAQECYYNEEVFRKEAKQFVDMLRTFKEVLAGNPLSPQPNKEFVDIDWKEVLKQNLASQSIANDKTKDLAWGFVEQDVEEMEKKIYQRYQNAIAFIEKKESI